MSASAPLARRLDASVSDAPTVELAHQLMTQLQVGNADLFRGALELLGWCVREVQDGRRIASVGALDESVREVTMPLLSPSRVQRRLVVSEAAAAQIAYLLEQPAAPPPALRELMERTRRQSAAPPPPTSTTRAGRKK
jgi:hypothetical protein